MYSEEYLTYMNIPKVIFEVIGTTLGIVRTEVNRDS
ncbi:Uncharacterised protein [[Clostridium] sordellii]|nr:Uncharacterised protein [[Clostridium] sordellii] [Paeniclostridium sordellii]